MALDTNIPLQAGRIGEGMNPFGSFQNALQMAAQQQDAAQQRQYRSMQMQNALQDMARQKALREAAVIGPDGKIDRAETAANMYKIDPATAQDFESKGQQMTFAQSAEERAAMNEKRNAEKFNIEQRLHKVNQFAQVVNGAKDQKSYEVALRAAKESGLDTSQAPAVYDPAFVETTRRSVLSVADQLNNEWRQKNYSLEERRMAQQAAQHNASLGMQKRGQDIQLQLAQAKSGADGAMPLSPGDRTKLREGSIKLNDLQSALNNYRDVLGKVGTRVVPGKDTAEVQAAYVNLMTLAKEAYNLGVLQGGDFALMEKSIKDPTGIMGNITGKPALINQLSQLDKLVADKRRNLNDAYSGKPLQVVPSNAPQTSSGVIGGGRTSNGGVKFLGFE